MRRRSGLALPASTAFALVLAWSPSACVPDFVFGPDPSEICSNGDTDEGETDRDCGGVCSPCSLGKRCVETSDCANGSCIERVCREPSCGDASLSPGETDIDCGGAHCAPCGDLEACEMDRDCESFACEAGRCSASQLGGGAPGDGDSLELGGGPAMIGSGGSDSSGGASSGGSGSGGVEGTGGEASSGGAGSGGAGSGGAGSGGAGSGGAGSGGVGSGGAPASLCELAGWLFCDDFEDGNANGWSPSGGTWQVVSSSENEAYSGAGGSEESLAGPSWTDAVVEARVKIVAFGGTGGSYRAGIVGRFSGPSDFFTFSIDATGSLRLLKSTSNPSGASGTCGSISHPFTVGTWYDMAMEISGGSGDIHIKTYIDSVLQHDCHTTQSGVVSGQAGVLTVGSNTVAHFDDVTVVGL